MRIVKGLIVVCLMAFASASSALELGSDLFLVPDGVPADGHIEVTVTGTGAIRKIELLDGSASAQEKVIAGALDGWFLDPGEGNTELKSVRLRQGFLLRPAVPVDAPPRLLKSPGTLLWPAGESRPEPIYPTQTVLIEGDAPSPAVLENEIWLAATMGQTKPDHDLLHLELLVDAGGQVVAARPVEAVSDRSIGSALTLLWKYAELEPALAEGEPAPAKLVVPVRYYASANLARGPVPNFPPAMLGMTGSVTLMLHIERDGRISSVDQVASAHARLEDSVLKALVGRKVTPAQRLGVPMASIQPMKYTFKSATERPIDPYAARSSRAPSYLPEELQYDVAARVVTSIEPVYPLALAREGVSGSASVALFIDTEGNVREVKVAEATDPEFGAALMACMQAWHFEPATKDGKPVWSALHRSARFSDSRLAANSISGSARSVLAALKQGEISSKLDQRLVPRFQPPPVYPEQLQSSGVVGKVDVAFYVDEDGLVQWPHAVAADNEVLAWSAVTAVSRWRFDPPIRDGKPALTKARVRLAFALPESPDATAR